MKIGKNRMWKLLSADPSEENYVMVNGKPLYCEIDTDGVTFKYGNNRLRLSNRDEENLVRNDADCQRLCDRVNNHFGIQ